MAKYNYEDMMISDILSYLKSKNIVAWRQNNVGNFRADDCISNFINYVQQRQYIGKDYATIQQDIQKIVRFSYNKVSGALKGVSDIMAISPDGKWIAIEVKMGSDRLSTEQDQWLSHIKNCGGYTFVVRNFDFFKKQFQENCINKLNQRA